MSGHDEVDLHGALPPVEREDSSAGAPAPPRPQQQPLNKLFVGSISIDTTNEMLRELFETVGDLVECKILLDPTTQVPKGFAYVTYRRAEDAAKAIETLNGTELNGRNLKVEYAKDKFQSWGAQYRIATARSAFEDKPPPTNPANYKELPFDKANKIPFVELCNMLDRVRITRGSKQKLDLIFGEHSSLPTYLKGGSWYPILRLILPDMDRERPRYGLKAQAMAKLFVKALGISKDHPDAVRLISWKDPNVAQSHLQHHQERMREDDQQQLQQIGAVGDFPNVLRDVLEKRGFSQKSTQRLSVGQINERLDQLHNANTTEEKEDVLIKLLKSCNAMEMYWLTRIVLKDLNCGLRFESVLKRYHRDAIQAMDAHGDLRRCVAELSDPNVSRAYVVELFSTVSPMLAKVVKMDQATEKLGDFVIEPKMDGDRMLVHIDRTLDGGEPKVMLFTRNGNDYTTRYGSPDLFKNLLEAFKGCRRCIIDGEMLSWDDEQERVLEFGQTTTVANEMNDSRNYSGKRWLYYVCFDALMIDDGRNLSDQSCVITGEPLRVRRSRLQSVFTPLPRKVEMIEPLVVTDPDLENRHRIVMQELDKMITIKGEGLILKSLASPYVPGETGRKQGLWVKVKPEHVSGLQEELDCLILGGYFSEGQRRSSKHALDPSVFLVGVPSNKGDEFFCLAKVGTGYTFSELEDLRRRLRPHLIRTADPSAPRPKHFQIPVRAGDFPDVWVPPEHSIVLQVTGSELVTCDWFSANYTLRFPRCTRIRWDKSATECTLYSDVIRFAVDFKHGTGLHGAKRAVEISRLEAGRSKRQQPIGGGGALATTRQHKRQTEEILQVGTVEHLKHVQVEENAPLIGWTFYVFKEDNDESGFAPVTHHPEMKTQQDVERYLKRKGGNVVKTLGGKKESHFLILASERSVSRPSLQMRNVFKTSLYDIFRVDFVVECCEDGRSLTAPRFSDYLFISNATRETMPGLDEFGDAYTERSDLISLERCMKEVEEKQRLTSSSTIATMGKRSQKKLKDDQSDLTDVQALKTYLELCADQDDPLATATNVMRGCIAYFPYDLSTNLDAKFAAAVLRLHGGVVRGNKLDEYTTHVFFLPDDEEKETKQQRVKEEIAYQVRPKISSPNWREPMLLRTDFILECCCKANHSLTWDLMPRLNEFVVG